MWLCLSLRVVQENRTVLDIKSGFISDCSDEKHASTHSFGYYSRNDCTITEILKWAQPQPQSQQSFVHLCNLLFVHSICLEEVFYCECFCTSMQIICLARVNKKKEFCNKFGASVAKEIELRSKQIHLFLQNKNKNKNKRKEKWQRNTGNFIASLFLFEISVFAVTWTHPLSTSSSVCFA